MLACIDYFLRVFGDSCGSFSSSSVNLERRQHGGEDLEPQVLLVAEAVRAPLEDTDLVVQPLDKAEGHLVLGLAVGCDALPMALDHCGEAFERLEPLPFERRAPVLEESPGPGFPVVAPELPEGLFEQVGRVQSLVGREQKLQTLLPLEGQILPVGQEGILLALDEPTVLARQTRVLALPHRVERVAQVAQHMERVEQDARLRRVGGGGGAKRLPHVHHREANPRGFLGAEPCEELIQAGLGAVRAAEPDRTPANEIIDDDPIGVPFPDRHLVEADDLRPGRSGAPQLLAHVLLLELLDRVPLQMQLLGDVFDGRGAANPRRPIYLLILYCTVGVTFWLRFAKMLSRRSPSSDFSLIRNLACREPWARTATLTPARPISYPLGGERPGRS